MEKLKYQTVISWRKRRDLNFQQKSRPREMRGLENYRQSIIELFNALPDYHVTVEDMIAEGDKAVIRYTWTGTHKSTNKKVTMWQIDVARITGGKFVEKWARYDTLGYAQQLGLIPTAKEET
jgi:predicted ester cyclase